jgi:TonB family protein
MTLRLILAALIIGCGSDPAPVAPAPVTPAPVTLTPEEQAHRDAELADWLAVDAIAGRCYEPVRLADPSMTGSVSVRFTVLPDGHAHDVHVENASPHDAAAEACIVSAVEAMPFTPSATPVERTIERRFEDP